MEHPRILKNLWPILTVSVTLSLILTLGVLFANNTLEKNGSWRSVKAEISPPLPGARPFFTKRNPMVDLTLNLNDWHGQNYILYKDKLTPTQIGFAAQFPFPDSETNLIFAANEKQAEGIRFSRKRDISGHFLVNKEGEFLKFEPLEFSLGEAWQEFKVVFGPSQIDIYGQKEKHSVKSFSGSVSGRVGFRDGGAGGKIDRVSIYTTEGLIKEDFDNRKFFWPVFLKVFVILLVVSVLILRVGDRWHLYSFAISSGSIVVLVILFDFFFWAKHYRDYSDKEISKVVRQIERFREEMSNSLWRVLLPSQQRGLAKTGITNRYQYFSHTGERVDFRLPRNFQKLSLPEDSLKVAFLGTSQTYGLGADELQDTFVARTAKKLNAEGIKASVFNFSYCGSQSGFVINRFLQFTGLKWNIIVVNFGFNDKDPRILRESLKQLVQIPETKVIFISEPDMQNSPDSEVHQVLRKTALEFGVKHLDLRAELNKILYKNSGFLWWDFVHLSDFGHKVVADVVGKAILAQVPPVIQSDSEESLLAGE